MTEQLVPLLSAKWHTPAIELGIDSITPHLAIEMVLGHDGRHVVDVEVAELQESYAKCYE